MSENLKFRHDLFVYASPCRQTRGPQTYTGTKPGYKKQNNNNKDNYNMIDTGYTPPQ